MDGMCCDVGDASVERARFSHNFRIGVSACYFWGALIGAGASLLGGAMSAQGAEDQQDASERMAKETREWQAVQNQKAMDFSERMSSSAHQREVMDLRLAGLNPVLSAGGPGASSPGGVTSGGATGVAQNELEAYAMAAANGVNSAMQASRLDAELDNMRETNKNIAADTSLKEDNARLTRELQQKAMADTVASQRNADLMLKQGEILDADVATAKSTEEYYNTGLGQFTRKVRNAMNDLLPFFSAGNSARSMTRR